DGGDRRGFAPLDITGREGPAAQAWVDGAALEDDLAGLLHDDGHGQFRVGGEGDRAGGTGGSGAPGLLPLRARLAAGGAETDLAHDVDTQPCSSIRAAKRARARS